MTLYIKPGSLGDQAEFKEFRDMIATRRENCKGFQIDLSDTEDMNLSQFNALVMLYVELRRAGIYLQYANPKGQVKNFVDKTNFHHVFVG